MLTVVPLPEFANLTNGPVLHLNFDGNYADSSGLGNNSTPFGPPPFVAGKIGQVYSWAIPAAPPPTSCK